MRQLILITLAIYIIFLILGFYSYSKLEFDDKPSSIFDAKTDGILENNLLVIVQLLAGAILFGSTTVLGLCYNAQYFGYLIAASVVEGVSLKEVIFLTLPHGIFEIPAIIIAGAAGFKIPYEITRYLAGKKDQILTRQDIKDYVTLALISIVLIVIAAWIEANITMRIAESMLNSSGG